MTSPSASASKPRRSCRLSLALLAGVALELVTGVAAAEPLPVDLSWQAPADCPQRDAVLARAQRILGSAQLKTTFLRANGDIQEVENGYELRLSIDDGTGGERRVWARQCDELGGTAALALVLLLTSNPEVEREPAEPPKSPPVVVEPPKPPPKPPEQNPDSAPLRFFVTAPQLGLEIGPLPKAGYGLGLGLGLEGRYWSVRALGEWGFKQRVASEFPDYGAEVQRATAGLWSCLVVSGRAWTLLPCAQASFVYLKAKGYGPFVRATSETNASAAVGVGLIGRAHLSASVALMVGAGVQIELSRPQILLGGVGPVDKLESRSATLMFGPEWFF